MQANIYVSSTFVDLQTHRAKVRDAIRTLGHVDLAMEYYGAEPERPLVRCLNDVQRCDLYVGLFARRYGFVPPGSARSITEQEYRAAAKYGKDILCFLLRDDAEWPDPFVDTGELAEKLTALRQEILPNHLAGFFDGPDELATKVSAAIVHAVQLATTPVDVERENRLMKEWRRGSTRADRVRARQALLNMGSPRYTAAIKDLLLEANEAEEVEEMATYTAELLELSVTSRQAMPIFLDLLHSDQGPIRVFTLFQIGELGLRGKEVPVEVVRAIVKLQSDQTPAVRRELAHTLGKIRHFEESLPVVRACLEKLAGSGDSEVRTAAEDSLELTK